jgi:hypothetical protein
MFEKEQVFNSLGDLPDNWDGSTLVVLPMDFIFSIGIRYHELSEPKTMSTLMGIALKVSRFTLDDISFSISNFQSTIQQSSVQFRGHARGWCEPIGKVVLPIRIPITPKNVSHRERAKPTRQVCPAENKICYGKKDAASTVNSAQSHRGRDKPVRYYHCEHCNQYHLTKSRAWKS